MEGQVRGLRQAVHDPEQPHEVLRGRLQAEGLQRSEGAVMVQVDLKDEGGLIEASVDLDSGVEMPWDSRAEIVVKVDTIDGPDNLEEQIQRTVDAVAQTLTNLGIEYDALSFAVDWFDEDERTEVEQALDKIGASTWAYRFNDEGRMERVNK